MRQLSEFSTSLATNFQKVTLTIYSLHFPLNYPSGETLAHFACLDKNYWISSLLCDERELQSSGRKLVKITSARPFDLLVVFQAFLLPPLLPSLSAPFCLFENQSTKQTRKAFTLYLCDLTHKRFLSCSFDLKYAEVRKNIFFLFHFSFFISSFCTAHLI